MKAERADDGSYRIENIGEFDLGVLQFILSFMVELHNTNVFSGRFMGAVRRMRKELKAAKL